MSSHEELLVWLLQTGEPLHVDADNPRPMRAMNLADALVNAGHRVVLFSSRFDHQRRRQREQVTERIVVSECLEIRLIASRGYARNIGIDRLLDHAELARDLKRMLRAPGPVPDVGFVGYPPIETAAVMTRWLAGRGVPVMLDVKDQWPTLFLSAVPAAVQPLARVALSPYFYFARRAMRDATGLSAMADTFLGWALGVAGRGRRPSDGVFPLTTALDAASETELDAARAWWNACGIGPSATPRYMFVGSHSRAFDFEPVRAAAEQSLAAGLRCEFVICGDSDGTAELREMMSGLGNVQMPGWVDRPQLIVLAERSVAALAPYRNTTDFRMSVPNKVLDAMSLGLPVLSPLQGEVGELIAGERVGLSYAPAAERSLYDCVATLAREPELRAELAARARATYAARFSFDRVYGGLVSHLEGLASSDAVGRDER